MAIEFKCSTCGKDLFAQEHYAGMRTTCPGCQTKLIIPSPGAPSAESARESVQAPTPSSTQNAKPVEALLVDMESLSAREAESEHAPSKPESAAAPVQQAPGAAVESAEPTKRCPFCAEKVLAAARKCRFCGEYFDDDVKRSSVLEMRRASAEAALQVSRRSEAIWRGAAVLMTMLTAGWLTFLTLECLTLQFNSTIEPTLARAPWTLYIFNVLLIGGLFSLTRQMKTGPFHVFLSAAFAIVVCVPIDAFLGWPMPGVEELKSKNEFYKTWSTDDIYRVGILFYTIAGALISLPVWFAALMVAIKSGLSKRAK